MTATQETESIACRLPVASDATAVWNLIRRCPPLDVNSGYAYIVLCDLFADTCVVCERNGGVVGFVSGFIPPNKPDTLFIWQVAVDSSMRGQGLAGTMIRAILSRDACRDAKLLETTVSPSNEASRKMFGSVAKSLGAEIREASHYDAALIPEDGHESENLITIGPFSAPAMQ